ncbi:MAG: biopolymer transporter ExbD [Oligoflexia bacterium]|nr:biopolymer transporter ExbD [Oligoflexia bacterium]
MGSSFGSSSRITSLRPSRKAISDINVTPFVDVVLVLLVIFMLTAPLMYNGIKLELPKTKKVNTLKLSSSQVILSMSPTGDFYIGKEKFLIEDLIAKIKSEFEHNKTETLFLRAHYKLEYGKVAKLMSFLKKSGINNIALVTEIEE